MYGYGIAPVWNRKDYSLFQMGEGAEATVATVVEGLNQYIHMCSVELPLPAPCFLLSIKHNDHPRHRLPIKIKATTKEGVLLPCTTLSLSLPPLSVFLSALFYTRSGFVLHLRSSNDGVRRRLHNIYSTSSADVLLRGQSDDSRNGSLEAAHFRSWQPQV